MDVFGPFLPLLWSPELMMRTSAMGDYLRYQSAFPPHLSEFIILVAVAPLVAAVRVVAAQSDCPRRRASTPPLSMPLRKGAAPRRCRRSRRSCTTSATELIESGSVSDDDLLSRAREVRREGRDRRRRHHRLLHVPRHDPEYRADVARTGRTSAASRSPGQERWIDRLFTRLRHSVMRPARGGSRCRTHQFPLAFPLLTGGHEYSSSQPCTFLLPSSSQP